MIYCIKIIFFFYGFRRTVFAQTAFLHLSLSINRIVVYIPAGQCLSLIWAKYSSLKYFIVVITGFGADLPNPHNDVVFTVPHISRSSQIFFFSISIADIFKYFKNPSYAFSAGVHLPHDSSAGKQDSILLPSTIQVFSSLLSCRRNPSWTCFIKRIENPPEINNRSGMHPPEGPYCLNSFKVLSLQYPAYVINYLS